MGLTDVSTASAGQTTLLTDLLAQRTQTRSDLLSPRGIGNVGIAFLDTPASSLASLVTTPLGLGPVDSFAPDSWDQYHRQRPASDTINAIPSLLIAIGGVTRLQRGAQLAAMANAPTGASRLSQLQRTTAALAYSRASEIQQVEGLVARAVASQQTSLAGAFGQSVSAYRDTQTVAGELAQYGRTMGEVRTYVRNARLVNGLREGIAQEVATLALLNQNEFLFPESLSAGELAALTLPFVGVNVGLEHIVGRAAMRKAFASAGQDAAVAAERARGIQQMLVAGDTTGVSVVGNESLFFAAGDAAIRRADDLETQIDRMVADSDGLVPREVFEQGFAEIRQAGQSAMDTATAAMLTNQTSSTVLRQNGISRSVSMTGLQRRELQERLRGNYRVVGGLEELTDTRAVLQYEETLARLRAQSDAADSQLLAARASGDTKAEARAARAYGEAQDQLTELQQFRASVIERTGVSNGNPYRAVPRSEQTTAATVRYDTQTGNARFAATAPGESPMTLNVKLGQLTREGLGDVDEAALSFQDRTAINTLVGEALTKADGSLTAAAEELMETIVRSTDPQVFARLPAAVLDALNSGAISIRNSRSATHPAAGARQQLVDTGALNNLSLAKKVAWLRNVIEREGMDPRSTLNASRDWFAMDMEKALNVRLTDAHGQPNELFDGMFALATAKKADGSYMSVEEVLVTANPNEGFDNLVHMGAGAAGRNLPGQLDTATESVSKAILDQGELTAHRHVGGIGAIHRQMSTPTDTEAQMAVLAKSRSSMREQEMLQSSSEFVSTISQTARAHPMYAASTDVGSILDFAISENSTVTTRTFRARNSPAHQAAHEVGQAVQKASDQMLDAQLRPLLEDVRALKKNPRMFASVIGQLSNAHHMTSRGVALVGDAYATGLNKIDMSRPGAKNMLANLERMNGGPLKNAPGQGEEWMLFDVTAAANRGEYVPVALTDEGAMMLNRWAELSHEQWKGMNALRLQQGKRGMPRLNGHLPTLDARRYKYRYIRDDQTGRVVGTVRGKTEKEAEANLVDALEGMRAGGGRFSEVSQTYIRQHYDAHDAVFMDQMVDMTGIKQSGQAAGRGTDFRLDLSGDLLEEMTISVRNTHNDLKDRTLAQFYAPQLTELSNQQAGMKTIPGRVDGKQRQFNAGELYGELLLASERLPEDSVVGGWHKNIEDTINTAVGRYGEDLDNLWRSVSTKLGTSGEFGQPLTKAEEKLAEAALDAYEPFAAMRNSDIAAAAKISPSVDPFKAERTLQVLNRAATAAFLKLANIAHPILNFVGVAATSPAVVRQVQPMPGESMRAWKLRVGPIADHVDDVQGFATINPVKATVEGFEMMMRNGADVQYAARHGYLEANMLEEINRLNSIHPSRWDEVGDAIMKWTDFINTPVNAVRKRRPGYDPKSADTISERSEVWTRGWSHMIGVGIARRGSPNISDEAAHAFGHYFANQNIADFAPNIRGDVFQGIAGIPIGLFQSYGVNLLQRVFRYVEDGNKRALIIQAVMQSALFGAQGLPGVPLLNSMTYDKTASEEGQTMIDRVYNNLGKGVGDLLMTGSISTAPMLLGSNTGINFYTSGDMNPRLPTAPPALSFLQQLAQGVGEMGKRTFEEIRNAADPEVSADFGRVVEAFANYAPSRGHRALTELWLGEKIDRRGNLIVDNTWSPASLFARMLTTRTTNEIQLSEGIWQNGQAQRQRIDDMTRVRQQILGQLRDGQIQPDEVDAWIGRYLAAGGREDQWTTWVNRTLDMAFNNRGVRAADTFINNNGEVFQHNIANLQRLMNAGIGPDELQQFVPGQEAGDAGAVNAGNEVPIN